MQRPCFWSHSDAMNLRHKDKYRISKSSPFLTVLTPFPFTLCLFTSIQPFPPLWHTLSFGLQSRSQKWVCLCLCLCVCVVKDQGTDSVTLGNQNCWLFSYLNRWVLVFKAKSQWEGETIDTVWMWFFLCVGSMKGEKAQTQAYTDY